MGRPGARQLLPGVPPGRAGSQRAPLVQCPREAGAAQAAPQRAEGVAAPPGQQFVQRREVGRALLRKGGGQLIPLEQLHVEIAHRPGEGLHPAQLHTQMGPLGGRVHPVQLAEHRACSPNRDAQVVEELGVEVIERPGHVRLGDIGKPREHHPGRLVGGGPAGELRAGPRGEARGPHTGDRRRFVEQRHRGGGEAELPGQLIPDPLERLVVTEHGAHPEARREPAAAGSVADDLGLLELQAHHGLGVVVQHRQRARPAANAHERQQRTRAKHRAEPVAHLAGRQLRGQVAGRTGDLGSPRRGPRFTQRERPRGLGPGGALGGEAGRPQATVERVEQHPVEPPRPAHLDREPVGEQRDEGGTVQRCRQHKLEPGRPHGRKCATRTARPGSARGLLRRVGGVEAQAAAQLAASGPCVAAGPQRGSA